MTDIILRSMKSLSPEQVDTVSEDEDIALKSDIDDRNNNNNNNIGIILEVDDEDSDTTTTVTTTTTTTVTTVSQKFIRYRGTSKSNKYPMINEQEMTELTETTQFETKMAEMTEMTQTEMTQTEMTKTEMTKTREISDEHKNVIIITSGDEIKCCNKIDIYTGLYIIFSYNAFIAFLLILIIIWAFTLTDITYIIFIWCLLFLLIRICIAILGFIIIPKMVGLHGDELHFVKQKYFKLIRFWSILLLYGPIIFNIILLIAFIIYSIILGILLSNNTNNTYNSTKFGQLTLYQNIDHFTAKFLLFCMAFISIIVIIDTICEVMFYDTVKKFIEAKLQCKLCPIPCQK